MAIAPGIILTPLLMSLSEDVRAGLSASIPFPKRLGAALEFADSSRTLWNSSGHFRSTCRWPRASGKTFWQR